MTGAAKAESVQLVLPASSGELALPTPAERVLAALPPLTAELATAETAGRAAAVAKRVAALITIAKAISQRGRFLNKIARLHIEAIAKAGELLAATVKRGGSKFRAGTLPTGVDKKHSHRWQAIARVPVVERERFFAACDEADEEITTAGLLRTAKHLQRTQKIAIQVEALRKEAIELPRGPFRTVVVDPPWSYELRADDASHRGSLPYPSMTIDAIKALDIGSRAAEDSVLWLWTTNAHLPEAFGVAAAWGFIYKNTLTWDKQRMGLGDWLRGQTEHCLLCIRGNPTIDLTNQTTLLSAPARKHSQKPEEFYEMVEALCPGSKADVFARTQRDGWASYGDEVSA